MRLAMTDKLVKFSLLADPEAYSANTFEYANGSKVGLEQWLEVFRKSIPTFRAHAEQDTAAHPDEAIRLCQAAAFATEFNSILDMLRADPSAVITGHQAQPVNCANLCTVRDACLHNAGFRDIFKSVKDSENVLCLALLPGVLAELDGVQEAAARLELALKGVFAGNLFDLGAAASAEAYAAGGMSFASSRAKLLPRPWAVDHLDQLMARFASGPAHKKAILFVDNAGADVVLGMLPLARELLWRGTDVVLAANEHPSINDITAAELQPLLQAAAAADDSVLAGAVAAGRIRVVSSGNDIGVIDLSRVSPAIAAEAETADLVILEGMGRGIETNLNAKFKCDVMNLGLIKHPEVAEMLGGRMYDCVCRFTPAPSSLMN